MSTNKLTILVIGATGAQGSEVVNALLKPKPDGSPSPYQVRALTRDASGRRALALKEKGVELVEGLPLFCICVFELDLIRGLL